RFFAFQGAQLREVPYELHNVFAQQRLAARQSNLRDPEPNQYPRHPQIIFKRQLRISRPVGPRPAINTAVVTAVGDGDPQVVNRAPEIVGKWHLADSSRKETSRQE